MNEMSEERVTIYFVRHAETYLNFYERLQGWSNAPLTSKGKLDARRSGKGIKDVKFDAVYTSDLARTRETAELILNENEATDPNMEIIAMPEFREKFFGFFEGEYGDIAHKEIAEHLGYEKVDKMMTSISEIKLMNAYKELDPYDDAEDFMEFWLRLEKGMLKLINRHRDTGDTILLVAHGGTIQSILNNLVLDLDDSSSLLNASVSVSYYEDGLYHLEQYGDVSHFVDERELDD